LTQDDLNQILITFCNATNLNPNDTTIATTATGISIAPRTTSINSAIVSPGSGLSGGSIAGIIVAIIAISVVLVMLIVWRIKSVSGQLDDLRLLPEDVRYFWEDCVRRPKAWTVCESGQGSHTTYYSYQIRRDTDDWARLQVLVNSFDGKDFDISEAYAIYNPVLTLQAINFRKLLGTRIESNPSLFNKTDWKNKEDSDLRSWVKSQYETRFKIWEWNKDLTLPIVPTLHGTDADVAWKIASTGFVALSALDAGWYGQGIYFSTYALYTIPYLLKPKPALIISYCTPGNVFPVIENPKSPNRGKLGCPIQAGYNSHYVITNSKGYPLKKKAKKNFFDELVLNQEPQVAPAFVLIINKDKLNDLALKFNSLAERDVVRDIPQKS